MDSSLEFKRVMSLVAALALFTTFVIPLPAHASLAEAQALLQWKSSLGNHSVTSLSSWICDATGSNSTISACAWYGISCNQAGSVIGINLTNIYVEANLIAKLQGMMKGQNGQKPQDKSLYMTKKSARMVYEDSVKLIMKGRETKLVRILTILATIDLSLNSFEGNIPNVIGHLYSLIGLNLSHNHLTGSIPLTLVNLTNLEWLDLSSNKLNGGVPRGLGDLSFLGYLDLSKNQLTGRIPQDKQLSTFTSNSFYGNLDLCGTPLQNTCLGDAQPPPPPWSFFQEDSIRECGSRFDRKVVGIGYASRIVIGISIAYISFETGRPKWLGGKVRSMERRTKLMKKPKRKAIKFLGG